MSVTELDARLDQRFAILTGGSRAALPRQQTLLAMLDWSWELLQRRRAPCARPPLRFRRRVRPGRRRGCRRRRDEVPPDEVVGLLGALVDKNLVQFEDTGGRPVRYRLLETVRQYAARKLRSAGARRRRDAPGRPIASTTWPSPRPRHRSSWASDQAGWLDRLDLELDNLRAAIALQPGPGRPRARDPAGRPPCGCSGRRAGTPPRESRPSGPSSTCRRPRSDAAARPRPGHRGLPAGADRRVRDRRGILRGGAGHCPGRRGRLPDRRPAGRARLRAAAPGAAGRRAAADRVWAWAWPAGWRNLICPPACWPSASFALDVGGDHAGATRDAAESLLLYRQAGDQRQVGTMLGNLGYAELSAGRPGAARATCRSRSTSPARWRITTASSTRPSTSAWPSTSAAPPAGPRISSPNRSTWPGGCGCRPASRTR